MTLSSIESNIENLAKKQWHQQSITDIAQVLKTNLETGLSKAEVAKRQELYGFNELKGKVGKSALLRFLDEFNPHSARNGRGQTIKKQAQGGDSSAGKQEKRNLKCEDEEPTN